MDTSKPRSIEGTMRVTVKTLKGSHFKIWMNLTDTIMAVKKKIEGTQGKDSYPWGQLLLIHNGKILEDESTLEENKVSEDDFLVVMSKASGSSGASSAQPSSTPKDRKAPPSEALQQAPQALAAANTASEPERPPAEVPSKGYDQTVSSSVSRSYRDQMINELMEIGGGTWERDKVLTALRATNDSLERAMEYLYLGVPITPDDAVPAAGQEAAATETASTGGSHLSGMPNITPLNIFPQGDSNAGGGAEGGAGGRSLDFLRSNQQFQALREMFHTNPRLFQSMLRELSRQNPQLLRMVQENHSAFLQLLNEPLEDSDGYLSDESEHDDISHAMDVTPEEQEAIGRLEAMGFDRQRVIVAFLACDRNELLAANYLLEHDGDED